MHTVTVLAPVPDVAPNTRVVAAITAGQVTQLPRDAILRADGDLQSEGKTIAHVTPADTIALAAVGGDDVGYIHVRRKLGFDVLIAAGLAVLVGGRRAAASSTSHLHRSVSPSDSSEAQARSQRVSCSSLLASTAH
jgi:hypothetical protein